MAAVSWTGVDGRASGGSQIAVIGKAIRVLEALSEAADGATPSQVAECVGVTRSTAFRLLVSLETGGLLDHDRDTGRYRLGLRLLRLGDAVRQRLDLVRIAEPKMLRLRDQVRQSVYLSVRDGWGAVCMHRLPGPDVDVLAWKPGQWLPLHVAAGSRALLAALPDDELDAYLALDEDRRTLHGQMSVNDLRRLVEDTRTRGWSLNLEDLTEGISSLGVTVRDTSGAAVCAISVAGVASRYGEAERAEIADAVIAAARACQDALQ